MTVNLSALAGAGQQFFDNNGNVLSGGKLWSYDAGTTTPQATYTTAAGNVAHTNPIILDSAGRVPSGQIWLDAGENYKFVLMTSADVTLASYDNITGINGTGITSNASSVVYDPAGTGAVPTTVQAKLQESPSVSDYVSLAAAMAANPGPILLSPNRLGGVQYATDRRDTKYRFLAGVIRQNSPGSGWYFIDDSGHEQAGFAGTFSILGSDLVVDYGFSASKVVSFIAVPDETFASGGLTVGASVGTSSAILSFYTPFDMRTSGTAIAVGNYLESGVDVTATFDVAAGTCVVTHPVISHVDPGGGAILVEPMGLPDGNQFTGAASSSKTGFTLNYRNAIAGRVNGAQLSTVNTGTSISWDGTSTLTITHPASGTSLQDVSLTPGDGTYIPVCTGSTATTITVQFRDYAGALYSGASNPAIFRYMRGGIATSTISGSSKLQIRRGLVQARASFVSSTGGNIWLYAVMEEA